MSDFRPCNLCGEKEKIDLVFSKNHYLIIKCNTCKLVYVDSIPTNDELEQIYSENFFNAGIKFKGGQNNPTVLNAGNRVKKIVCLPNVGLEHWLDIGCATGEFIFQAKKHVKDALGVEFSTLASQKAELLYGVSVLNADFIDTDLKKDYFDVITAWDFIEHIKDPLSTFRKIYNHLKPGGYLILSTGDMDSISSKISGKFWHLMIPPKHLYFFSKITIKKYLEKIGFEQININYPNKYVPLDFIIWKFFYQISPRMGDRLLSIIKPLKLGRMIFSINLYDIMEVYARKPQTT